MKKRKQIFIILILSQLFFSTYLSLALISDHTVQVVKVPITGVFVVSILSTISSLWLFRAILLLLLKQKKTEIELVKKEEAEKLIRVMKTKAHDFLNHLQVILGLAQMERTKELTNYIKGLSKELRTVDSIVALERPDVAALLSGKLALDAKLKTILEINTNLRGLIIPPEKVVSILGNLIDNAIYEAFKYEEGWVSLKIYEDNDMYTFEIGNQGYINPDTQVNMLHPGFTTKSEGSGMGLFITEKLVNEYKGKLSFCSSEAEGTVFTVKLPKLTA